MVENTTNDWSDEPTKHTARVARDVIDDVLLRLGHAGGRTDRRALLSALEATRGELDRLEQSALHDDDYLERVAGVLAQLAASVQAAGSSSLPDPERFLQRLLAVTRSIERAREASIDVLAGAHGDLLARARGIGHVGDSLGTPRPCAPFAASVGEPGLFELERGRLITHIDKAIPDAFFTDADEDEFILSEPHDDDSLLALLPKGDGSLPILSDEQAAPPAEAVVSSKRLEILVSGAESDEASAAGLPGELAQLRRSGRTFLEDVSANSNLRRLEATERFQWGPVEGFEGRMCQALDAFLALGTPFHSASAPAVARAGIDVLDEALRYGREALTADPGRSFARALVLGSVAGEDTVRAAVLALKQSPQFTHKAQVQAFSLASNPAMDEALVRLCLERDTHLLRFALEAAYARRCVDAATVAPLVEHTDDAVRIRAYRALGVASDRVTAATLLTDRLETEMSDMAATAAAEALALLGRGRGLAYARERLNEELESPGSLPSGGRLRLMALLGAVGGEADHALLAALYTGASGEAAALGAHGHVALAEVLLDVLVSSSPRLGVGHWQKQEAAEALVRITGAPILKTVADRYAPRTEPAAWQAWWNEFADEFQLVRRYRWGRPYSALAPLTELEADDVPVRLRQAAAFELAVELGEPLLSVETVCSTQRRGLARARASVEARLSEGTLSYGVWR